MIAKAKRLPWTNSAIVAIVLKFRSTDRGVDHEPRMNGEVAMEDIRSSLDTTLEIGSMSVPSKVVRFGPDLRATSGPDQAIPNSRVSGLPRHAQEVIDGTIVRR